jgi:hypothetical protein
MFVLIIWYVCACLWNKYLKVVRKVDEKVIKQVFRNKMRLTLKVFSEYKAHSNSECRTNLFSSVTTDNVHFLAFLADYEQTPTRRADLFGRMGGELYLIIGSEYITKILRHYRAFGNIPEKNEPSIREGTSKQKTGFSLKFTLKNKLKKGDLLTLSIEFFGPMGKNLYLNIGPVSITIF